MPYASHPRVCAHARRGSILLMVLVVLGVAVMLAATFVGMMATAKDSGTRQSGRQVAAQTALAGMVYATQILMSDYVLSRANNIPQRYTDLNCKDAAGKEYAYAKTSRGQINNYSGSIPASATDRIGLDWKLPFDGGSGGQSAQVISKVQVRVTTRGNQWGWNDYYGYYQGLRTDPSIPPRVSAMGLGNQAVPMQYAEWNGSAFIDDGSVQTFSRYTPFMYYWPAHARSPRWWTAGYLDSNFQPLDWTDRSVAAFETRFSVQPIPIDGCININFGDKILSNPGGGRFRLSLRNPSIPPGLLELSSGVITSVENSAKGSFRDDQYDFDTGAKGSLSYNIGSTVSKSVGVSYPYQSYQLIIPADTSWSGPGAFPLAQQYGTAIGNMLGIWVVHDGGGSINVRKDSAVTWTGTPAVPPTLYNSYTVSASAVKTGGLYKATAGIGTLSKIMKITMGQGYYGNFYGYSNAGVSDPWYAPTVPASLQFGTPASFRQFHANLGYNSGDGYSDAVISSDRILPLMSFTLVPFGGGLDTTRIPDRNRGSSNVADIDCPWYVNVMTLNRDPAQAIVAGMDPEYYANMDNKNGNTGDSSGYPLNQSNMLPTPPDKPCPVLGASFAAKWNDGVARTGADGVEGGALPPLDATQGYVFSPATGWKRPPKSDIETGYHYPDRGDTNGYNPFTSGGPLVWRNPVADQLVSVSAPSVSYAAGGYYGKGATAWGMLTLGRWTSGEDEVASLVIGGSQEQAMQYANFPQGAEGDLDSNKDNTDERLSWQVDLIAAMYKTLVDCHYDRRHGKKLHPGAHGYETIEDVETVFLAYLGISVLYNPATSKASTTGASAGDYTIYTGPPAVADGTWPLGKGNQLWAMSQYTSEIGADRCNGVTSVNGDNINVDGIAGQQGYRNYTTKVSPDGNGLYPAGWPSGYKPTWAALSRILEHRLNDFRMSLFGTPALDFNQDGFTDATTTDSTGVVAGGNQLHFSCTGRLFLGRIHYWRVFTKAEVWDLRSSQLVSEASLERVLVMDPDGDGDLSDTNVLFSRWHRSPLVDGRGGPATIGRTEATP